MQTNIAKMTRRCLKAHQGLSNHNENTKISNDKQ